MMSASNSGQALQPPSGPGAEHKLLDVFIGKWINQGHTVASADAPSVPILTSDVYEWVPGGFFVLHTAYGRIGNVDVGGVEIISYDAASQTYRSHFFDSQGTISTDELTIQGDSCTWTGAMPSGVDRFLVSYGWDHDRGDAHGDDPTLPAARPGRQKDDRAGRP